MSGEPQSTVQFVQHREPPAEWVEELARVSPPNDDVPYLALWWRAGMWYEPVQRWTLYEMLPLNWYTKLIAREKVTAGESLTEEILNDLRGPDPRKIGHWYPDPRVPGGRRWFSDSLVDNDQWRLYQRTRCIPQLYWIIQGDAGGHKRVLSLNEVRLLEAAGHRNPDVPNAGDLEYAPFDRRVAEKIGERDKLKQWDHQFGTGFDSRIESKQVASKIVRREREQLRVAAQQELAKWLESQIIPVADELVRLLDILDAPRIDVEPDYEEGERSFIEDE